MSSFPPTVEHSPRSAVEALGTGPNVSEYAVGGGEEQGPSRPGEGIGDERLAQDVGEARIKRMMLNLRRSVSWRKAPDRVSNHRGAAACVEMLR